MSLHAYSRVWLHLVWATLERRPLLDKPAVLKLSAYLSDYAKEKGIYMKINYVNADHVHALIDLPTKFSVEEVMQLFKGSSSHWINENNLVRASLAGDAVTECFPFQSRRLRRSRVTSRIRKNIIGKEISRKN